MKPRCKALAVTALSFRALASSASAFFTIAKPFRPRQLQSSCTISFITSTSRYLVYQPEVFSNPPEVGGPAWSTRTTGTGLYATRTGTATLPVVYCEPTTTQALPTTPQEPSTEPNTSAPPTTVSAIPTTGLTVPTTGSAATTPVSSPASTATSDGTTEPQTVTSTIPPITVSLRVPERTEVGTSAQPSSTTSESVPEPDQTPTEITSQHIINTCAVTLAPSATIPPPAPFGPESDLTWGCPPGTNCDPPKPQLCEAWTDSPAEEFTCQAAHCQPVKVLILGSGNANGKFPLNEGYFDLDPTQFGLGFDIFVKPDGPTARDVHSLPPKQQHNDTKPFGNNGPHPDEARDLSTHLLPAACFGTCNNAYLEAQSIGKSTKLCRPESAFIAYYRGCAACVDRNAEQTTGALGFITSSRYLSGKFAQFLRFCKVTGDINVDKNPAVETLSSSTSGEKKASSSSRPAGAVASPDPPASPHPGAAFAEEKGPAGASPTTPSSSSFTAEAANHGMGPSAELASSIGEIPSAVGDRIPGTAPETPAQHSPQETPPGAMISQAEANVSPTEANASLIAGPTGTVVVTAGSSTWIPGPFGRRGALLFATIACIFIV